MVRRGVKIDTLNIGGNTGGPVKTVNQSGFIR